MICWSCEKAAGADPFCAHCQAVQPPAETDYFQVLDMPQRYELDLKAAEATYKRLSLLLHPDKFARSDPRARRASLGRTVQLNEAWRVLRDPVKRGEYLLRLQGIKVDQPVPSALLLEVMELREALADARQQHDDARVVVLAGDVRERRARALASVAQRFSSGAAPELAAAALVAMRYYDRFLEEVVLHEESQGAAGHGG